jgi:hypothetical protein
VHEDTSGAGGPTGFAQPERGLRVLFKDTIGPRGGLIQRRAAQRRVSHRDGKIRSLPMDAILATQTHPGHLAAANHSDATREAGLASDRDHRKPPTDVRETMASRPRQAGGLVLVYMDEIELSHQSGKPAEVASH